MKLIRLFILSIILCLSWQTAQAQDHSHLNIGAKGKNQGDQLVFDEAEIFEPASDYVKTLLYTNSGKFAGFYAGNITLTALSATPGHSAFSPIAPALGAWIFGGIASVEGPEGGEFAFWENAATSPTISVICGGTSTNVWQLTETNGLVGTDPYGHIHGRRFTATKPGIYVVGFRAVDHSTNGVAAGPIHTPSEVLKITFQAGDNIQSIEMTNSSRRIRFAAQAGYTWQLRGATGPVFGDWQPVGNEIGGDDHFHEVVDDNIADSRIYRAQGTFTPP